MRPTSSIARSSGLTSWPGTMRSAVRSRSFGANAPSRFGARGGVHDCDRVGDGNAMSVTAVASSTTTTARMVRNARSDTTEHRRVSPAPRQPDQATEARGRDTHARMIDALLEPPESVRPFLRELRSFVDDEIAPVERRVLASNFAEALPLLRPLRERAKARGLWAPQAPK